MLAPSVLELKDLFEPAVVVYPSFSGFHSSIVNWGCMYKPTKVLLCIAQQDIPIDCGNISGFELRSFQSPYTKGGYTLKSGLIFVVREMPLLSACLLSYLPDCEKTQN